MLKYRLNTKDVKKILSPLNGALPNIVKGPLIVAEVEHRRYFQEVMGSNPARRFFSIYLSSQECVL